MRTFADVTSHPLAPLWQAEFSNADAAAAIGVSNFGDYRKNWERHTNGGVIPRIEVNPTRPRYRLLHIYEWKLARVLEPFMSKTEAAAVIHHLFVQRGALASWTVEYGDLEPRLATTVTAKMADVTKGFASDFLFDRDLLLLSYFPWLGLAADRNGVDYLDRSPDGLKQHHVLVVAPENNPERPMGAHARTYGTTDAAMVGPIMSSVTKHVRSFRSSYPDCLAAVMVDVTAAMVEAEKALAERLDIKLLVGETEGDGE